MKFLMLIFILCHIYILKHDHNVIDYERNVGQPLFPTRGPSLARDRHVSQARALIWKQLFNGNPCIECRGFINAIH